MTKLISILWLAGLGLTAGLGWGITAQHSANSATPPADTEQTTTVSTDTSASATTAPSKSASLNASTQSQLQADMKSMDSDASNLTLDANL